MAKIINITDKLDLEKKSIQIGDTVIEVNDDAKTALKMLEVVSKGGKNENEVITEAYDFLFSKADKEKIESLKLNMSSFITLIKTAMSIVTGQGEEQQGE